MPDKAENPLVSVILPIHNGAAYLEDALASLQRQSFRDFETILIDDGSGDASPDIIDAWSSEEPEARRVTRTPGRSACGVAAARNTGLVMARGQLIAFLDQDDIWAENKLARQIEVLNAHPVFDLLATVPELLLETTDPDPSLALWHAFMVSLAAEPLVEIGPRDVLSMAPICMSSVLVRRRTMDHLGGFSEELRWTSDWDAWSRLSFRGRIGLMADRLVAYRLHDGNDFCHLRRSSGIVKEAGRIHDRLAAVPELVSCATQDEARRKIARLTVPGGWM